MEKVMFTCLDLSRFLVCYSEDLSDNKSEEKPSVSICRLTGLILALRSRLKCTGKANVRLVAAPGQFPAAHTTSMLTSKRVVWPGVRASTSLVIIKLPMERKSMIKTLHF